MKRRAALAWAGTAFGMSMRTDAYGVEPEVPIRLQVSLLDRVIPFDRNFGVRVHGQLSVVIVVDTSSEDSVRIGSQLQTEFSARESLGSYRIVVAAVTYRGTSALVESCQRLRAGIVYVAPGLRESTATLAHSLHGLRVLTVGVMPEQVTQGMILGAAVRSAKPRVLVNLGQARQQDVDFRADFLRMAEVVG